MEILMAIFIILFVVHGIYVERRLDQIAASLRKPVLHPATGQVQKPVE